jgi:hypothetical protein
MLIFCRLGWSAEQSYFGGKLESMLEHLYYLGKKPHFGFWRTSFPMSLPHGQAPNVLNLINPGNPPTTTKIPVPVTHYESLQQDDFWATWVRNWGLEEALMY